MTSIFFMHREGEKGTGLKTGHYKSGPFQGLESGLR